MTRRTGAGQKAHILVVDSDHSLRKTVSPLLRTADYKVSHAEGCVDALLQLHAMHPDVIDVIVSDLDLPDQAGLEFVSVLRSHCPKTPVIAVSRAQQDVSGVPANAFYIKGGYHPQEFLSTVAALVSSGPDGTAEVYDHEAERQEPPQGEAA